jgi:DedD protein
MPRTISDEQLQLKKRARRRLIGAIALVTLMVIVLPLLLDVEPKPVSPNISVQIPSENGGGFASRVVPANEKPGEAVAAEKIPKTEAVIPPPPPINPGAEKSSAPAKAAAHEKSEKTAKNDSNAGAYVVQLAAFSNADKARQLQQKLAAGGVRAYTEVLKTAEGEKTRVRAGPYDSRVAAEKALDHLKALGMDGVVTSR